MSLFPGTPNLCRWILEQQLRHLIGCFRFIYQNYILVCNNKKSTIREAFSFILSVFSLMYQFGKYSNMMVNLVHPILLHPSDIYSFISLAAFYWYWISMVLQNYSAMGHFDSTISIEFDYFKMVFSNMCSELMQK